MNWFARTENVEARPGTRPERRGLGGLIRAQLVAVLMATALSPLAIAGGEWIPAPGTTWQWQITAVVDESLDVAMYDIDLFDAAPAGIEIGNGSGVFTEAGVNAGIIERLHSRGIIVICYADK